MLELTLLSRLRKLALGVTVMLLPVVASALPYRAATVDDLVGFWEQITLQGEASEDYQHPWYRAPQFWEFFGDGFVRIIVFEKEVPEEDILTKIREYGPKRTTYQFLADDGTFRIDYPNGSSYTVAATYYNEDVPLYGVPGSPLADIDPAHFPAKGDITLTYYDLATQQPLFFRLLRYRGEPVEPIIELPEPGEEIPEPLRAEDDPVLKAIIEALDRQNEFLMQQ